MEVKMKILQNIKSAAKRSAARWALSNSDDENFDTENGGDIKLNQKLIKYALDSIEWNYTFDEEKECFVCINSIDDMNFYLIAIKASMNYIQAQAFIHEKKIEDLNLNKALLFCNKWNNERFFPKAYINSVDNALVAENIIFLNKKADKKFVKECIINNFFIAITYFFKEALEADFYEKTII